MIDYRNDIPADDVDDDAEVVYLDDEDDDDWLDDFDFVGTVGNRQSKIWDVWKDYAPRGTGAVGEAIGYSGRTLSASDQRVIRATKVAQGLVDTFCAGDRRYRVTFDKTVKTAGTDFAGRAVVITSAPLFDPALTEEQAATVLTGLAVHESDHDRYGRSTFNAAKKAFGDDPTARAIGNILDDYRIERARVREFPGLRDIYAPTLEWVARRSLGELKVDAYRAADLLGTVNIISAGVRYDRWTDWTGHEDERDYWQDWAARHEKADGRVHVAAINEALARLAAQQRAPEKSQPAPTPDGEGASAAAEGGTDTAEPGPETGAAASTSSDDPQRPETADSGRDGTQDAGGSNGAAEAADGSGDDDADAGLDAAAAIDGMVPGCLTTAASADGNATRDRRASRLVEDLEHLVLDNGYLGEVNTSPRGLLRRPRYAAANGAAAGVIRRAFIRSRGGHWGIESRTRSGRLDNRTLARVAEGDVRVCHRRSAPSPARHRVWLLVDCSISMGGQPVFDAVGVASALAAASRSLPNVELEIWGWTTARDKYSALGAGFGVTRVWKSGAPVANVGYLESISMGGTPDKPVLAWAGKAIQAACRPDERPLVIMASDGEGGLDTETVDSIRAAGVDVISVALGRLYEPAQERIYGRGRYIPWAGSVAATARPLGDLLARLAADVRDRRK